jgi:hypothetical protein
MEIINHQDGIIKSSLVQLVQHRSTEVANAQEGALVPLNEEMARKAGETVEATPKSENDGIREDEERQQGRRERRRRQIPADEDDSEEEKKSPATSSGSPHRIDITI